MKISYNWLKELINIKKNANELSVDLISLGHEVESIQKQNNDYILDINITANRGDCLSIYGIARELSALYNLKLNNFEVIVKTKNFDEKIKIIFQNDTICPRYTSRIIKNIEIKKSPKWLIEKLKTYGFRSINNIVDITNYVMILTGQPLHAYDFNKINGDKIKICLAKKDDYLITLDGIERKLDKNTIIIRDKNKIFDLAGIMGGFNTEINSETKNIFLESAIFSPENIRIASKKLKLQTDASYRYERSVDEKRTICALNLATYLINQTCPNSINGKAIDRYNLKCKNTKIKILYKKINHLLGISLNKKQINNYLNRLNFKIKNGYATVPSYRIQDVKIWQDLAEEVARIYGYEKITPLKIKKTKIKNNYDYWHIESIKDFIADNGFTEIISYPFANEKLLMMMGYNLKKCIEISNPQSLETKYLRPSLLPSILEAISKNPWAPEINIFELGNFFDPKEKKQVILATTAKKGNTINNFINSYNIKNNIIEVPQKILDYFKIRKKIFYSIFNIKEFKKIKYKIDFNIPNNKYKPIYDFPPTIRDFSFIVDKKIKNQNIIDEIYKMSNNILLVEQFDEFHSPKIGKNNKSVSFHVWMQSKSKLCKKLYDNISNKIIKKIKILFKGELRK